jgi:hypothetical protein
MTAALAVVAPRLGQLVRLLASDRDGEVLSAARALGRTLKGIGEDFHTLAAAIELSAAGTPHEDTSVRDWRTMARWLSERSTLLTLKERQFVGCMTTWRGEPSAKQREWLRAIVERVSQGGRA